MSCRKHMRFSDIPFGKSSNGSGCAYMPACSARAQQIQGMWRTHSFTARKERGESFALNGSMPYDRLKAPQLDGVQAASNALTRHTQDYRKRLPSSERCLYKKRKCLKGGKSVTASSALTVIMYKHLLDDGKTLMITRYIGVKHRTAAMDPIPLTEELFKKLDHTALSIFAPALSFFLAVGTDRDSTHSCICCADALCPAPCNAGIYACRAIRGFPKEVSCP